jgi:hypothetical protein
LSYVSSSQKLFDFKNDYLTPKDMA